MQETALVLADSKEVSKPTLLTPAGSHCGPPHACFIPEAFLYLTSHTGMVVWASSPWGPIFLLPSLHPAAQLLPSAPGAGACRVHTGNLGTVSGHQVTPVTLSGLRWTLPVLKLSCQQEKRPVNWILQPQQLHFRCGSTRTNLQFPSPGPGR